MEPGESLPKIVGDLGLHFPDLEEVPAVKPKEEKKKPMAAKPKLSMAKKRFNQMAFSVLAKIIDEKVQPDEEEEGEESAEKKEDGGKEEASADGVDGTVSTDLQVPKVAASPSPRRPAGGGSGTLSRHGSASSLATVESSGGTKVKKKSKKGPSFMSVLRLASYRKRMGGKAFIGRKGASSVASSLGDLEEDDEHISELPNQPRFCATLSKEAQYAMLKCYEDVLMDNIRNGKVKEPVPEDATLFRVKTPHDGFRSLHLAAPKEAAAGRTQLPQLGEDVVDGGNGGGYTIGGKPPSRESGRKGSSTVSRSTGSLRLPSIAHASRISSSTSSLLPGHLQPVPRDKQLRLSYRFQTAMDILDAVRDSNGELVTSPRGVKLGEINPLRNYNRWSKGWSKEFQYEYTGPPNGGGMAT